MLCQLALVSCGFRVNWEMSWFSCVRAINTQSVDVLKRCDIVRERAGLLKHPASESSDFARSHIENRTKGLPSFEVLAGN